MAPGDAESRRQARRQNRSVLVGLVAVFTVPILVAYGLNVWWPHWSPFGRMNHGELVDPSWKVELVSKGRSVAERAGARWILLHPIKAPCDDACEARLDLTKRIHHSLGKDYDRVVRMLIHPVGDPVEGVRARDAELILVPAPESWFNRFDGDAPVLLVVDPQRQAVLQYRVDLQAQGLARDLERMLKISKIG